MKSVLDHQAFNLNMTNRIRGQIVAALTSVYVMPPLNFWSQERKAKSMSNAGLAAKFSFIYSTACSTQII